MGEALVGGLDCRRGVFGRQESANTVHWFVIRSFVEVLVVVLKILKIYESRMVCFLDIASRYEDMKKHGGSFLLRKNERTGTRQVPNNISTINATL